MLFFTLFYLVISLVTPTFTCPIYLTVSIVGKTLHESFIEINWGPECNDVPDWIGVFRQDPSIASLQPIVRFTDIRNKIGKVVTNVKVGRVSFPGGWNRHDVHGMTTVYPKGKCLPYYVAGFKGTELTTVECLKIQPNWMSQMKDFANIPLKSLFIPGTHASGAYITNYNKTKSVLVKDYLVAQHLDIWSQLVFGIRYLDFSIGFKNSDKIESDMKKSYWIVNENMFINPLVDILRDIKRFVKSSGEIVILDFSSFPVGFYKHPTRYRDLLHILNHEIGDIAYRRNVSSNEHCYLRSFRDIRAQDKYLLILYPVEELPYPENESNLLCPTWQRFTTSYMNTTQILDYMRFLFARKPTTQIRDSEGWIFLAVKSLEQTLNSQKLLTVKERAATINPKIIQWLKGPWGLNANVVAMDYFSNTNVIDVAIYVNMHKAFLIANDHLLNLEIF